MIPGLLFFGDKIRRIRCDLDRDLDQVPPLDTTVVNGPTGCQLNMFSTVPPDELLSIIGSTTPKSCDLDPVPGHVPGLFPSILPVIHKIVNLSLETGRMPGILKQALLKPLLKKYKPRLAFYHITKLLQVHRNIRKPPILKKGCSLSVV